LVELLVVVAIIGVLVSILLPSLRKAREAARATVCMSNMRQVYIAFAAYAADNRGALADTSAAWYYNGYFWQPLAKYLQAGQRANVYYGPIVRYYALQCPGDEGFSYSAFGISQMPYWPDNMQIRMCENIWTPTSYVVNYANYIGYEPGTGAPRFGVR